MDLSNFEALIDKAIIDRGYNYFIDNRIDLLYYDEDKQEWLATILGTDEYEVHVCLSNSNEIIESYCDCPYDLGEYCKHQVAVFYALDDLKPTPDKSSEHSISTAEFEKLLNSVTKEDLIQLLLTLSAKDKDLKKRICNQFSFNATPIQKVKNLISSIYFEEYDYYDTSYETFTVPVTEALEICSTIDNPNTQLALYCQLVEEIALFFDDDDHYNQIYLAIEDTLSELTQFIETLSEDSPLRKKCFDSLFLLLEHFPHEQYDFIFEFIDLCIQTANTTDSQTALHSYLKKLQKSSDTFIAEEAPKLIYAFLEKYASTEEALAFAEII
ncbi:SWIM zinc finger family protein [Enterococcus rivorum]|uniref:SWIM zinc finger family protein n=1 Tax=Enterococcus rivorum TaxID=762845 RepID=UPI003629B715